MSHEQSETIQLPDGTWINVYGKRTEKAGQQLPGTPTYKTVEEAEKAAGERSASFNRQSFDPRTANWQGVPPPVNSGTGQ